VSGYVSNDEGELRVALETLLKNRPLAASIGSRGREEALDRFPIQKFVENWGTVLRDEPVHRAARSVDVMDRLSEGQPRNVPTVSQKEMEADSATLSDYYKKERRELAVLISEEARKILDVGCGGGHLGRLLKSQMEGREIWGVEMNADASEEARKWLDHVHCEDACTWEPAVEEGYFDVLVFADVLEHLLDPKATLEHYLRWLKPTGSVVMSIPNVRYWGLVKNLVDGYWTYEDEGLLDRDHVRFFTWTEVERLLASCGLECGEVRSNLDPRCPDVPDGKKIDLRLGRITLHDLEPYELREFFTFQYLVRGVRTKRHLVSEAERMEVEGRGPEAFRLYASLLDRDGTDTQAAGRLAEIGTTAEEKRKASKLLDECLHVHPANIELLLASARLLAEDERTEEARQRLERVLLFVPEHGEARARLDRLTGC
jgi:2-polyprenyl-3-methyl-5-hydroxy-6-metoxy-1,4-benzoquinol methylase